MNVEQEIAKLIIDHCGGALSVKGITPQRLQQLKKGTSGISTKKIVEILKANGMSGTLIIETPETVIPKVTTTIKLY